MKLRSFLLTFSLVLVMVSCKTYTIPVQSFKEQMQGITADSMKKVNVRMPLPLPGSSTKTTYFSNQIQTIRVVNKKGEAVNLANSPAIEMRVTLRNNKRYHFYFDTVILQNDTLMGGRSRFASSLIRKIPMDSIVKIEVQDGGKKIEYTQ
ncbi:hypothetical protein [Flavobacterium stagni]|nr:hypothetical protein [Flavobacterium stagni]